MDPQGVGVILNPGTPVSELESVIHDVDAIRVTSKRALSDDIRWADPDFMLTKRQYFYDDFSIKRSGRQPTYKDAKNSKLYENMLKIQSQRVKYWHPRKLASDNDFNSKLKEVKTLCVQMELPPWLEVGPGPYTHFGVPLGHPLILAR